MNMDSKSNKGIACNDRLIIYRPIGTSERAYNGDGNH